MKNSYVLACIAAASCVPLAGCSPSTLNNSDSPTALSMVSLDAQGAKHAPEPEREFHGSTCDTSAAATPTYPEAPGLYIAEIDAFSPLYESAELTFPEAPGGILWTQKSPFGGSADGATVTAGHVDYAPGALSPNGGELSPLWGHLHEANIDECTHIFATDFAGGAHEYVITSKYLVDQDKLATTTTALTHQGLSLITCAGKTIDAVGGENQFNYEKNLVIEAQEITTKGARS